MSYNNIIKYIKVKLYIEFIKINILNKSNLK